MIVVDNEKVAAETKEYKKIPLINDFKDENENDIMQQQIDRNYKQIKRDVVNIIEKERQRISKDKNLCHLLDGKKKEEAKD
jgi:hypothetical protein